MSGDELEVASVAGGNSVFMSQSSGRDEYIRPVHVPLRLRKPGIEVRGDLGGLVNKRLELAVPHI